MACGSVVCFFEAGGDREGHSDGSWYPSRKGLGEGLEFGLQKTEFYLLVQAGVGLDHVQVLNWIFGQLVM